MKNGTFPTLHLDPRLKEEAEQCLYEGEPLAGFIEESIQEKISRRKLQRTFLERGHASGEEARRSDKYTDAGAVTDRLALMLASAKAGK